MSAQDVTDADPMKYLQTETHLGNNECAGDAEQSTRVAELHLEELARQLDALPASAPAEERLGLQLSHAYTLLELHRFEEAWDVARRLLDEALAAHSWQQGAEACDVMFQTERDEAVRALAHGIWLSVTFPVDPELSVAMLQHLVDESPDKSDGAAVAAATASYIVDLRAKEKQREELQFFTAQLLGQVARRHSQVEEQDIFEFWVSQLELDDPGKFLPRLAKVLDIICDNRWWFDRDELRGHIPN